MSKSFVFKITRADPYRVLTHKSRMIKATSLSKAIPELQIYVEQIVMTKKRKVVVLPVYTLISDFYSKCRWREIKDPIILKQIKDFNIKMKLLNRLVSI